MLCHSLNASIRIFMHTSVLFSSLPSLVSSGKAMFVLHFNFLMLETCTQLPMIFLSFVLQRDLQLLWNHLTNLSEIPQENCCTSEAFYFYRFQRIIQEILHKAICLHENQRMPTGSLITINSQSQQSLMQQALFCDIRNSRNLAFLH